VTELRLTRDAHDRRLFRLDGVGSVRLLGWTSRRGEAEADGRSWSFERRGLVRTQVIAADSAGTVVGAFERRTWRRGGSLRWNDRALRLEPASAWRERYALTEDGRELALLAARSWGKNPVNMTVPDRGAVEPPLLLFAAFVARGLAADADAAAGGSAAAMAGSQ
jgi:hypothetical protein